MAGINDIMQDVESDDVYYEETKEKKLIPGTYEATIVRLKRRLNIKTKKGHLCDIYWPRYQINEDSPKCSGLLVRDNGQWRYRSKEVQQRNVYYKKFLDKLEISLAKTDTDGNIRYSLPSLSEDMIIGKQVLINTYIEEWTDSYGFKRESVAKLISLIKDA